MRKRVLPSEDTLSANSSAAAAVGCSTPPSTPRNTVIATGTAISPTIGGSESTAKYTVRIWSVSAAARNSRPNVQMPAIAATPVGKKTIENVLQISCLVVHSTLFSSYCKSIHFELYNKHIATLIISLAATYPARMCSRVVAPFRPAAGRTRTHMSPCTARLARPQHTITSSISPPCIPHYPQFASIRKAHFQKNCKKRTRVILVGVASPIRGNLCSLVCCLNCCVLVALFRFPLFS